MGPHQTMASKYLPVLFFFLCSVLLSVVYGCNYPYVKAKNEYGSMSDTPECIHPIRASTSSLKKFDLSKLVPEARLSGWKCGHSDGKGSCFVNTASYIIKVALSCQNCLNQINNPEGDQQIIPPDNASACPNCPNAVKNAPLCGGKFFGIGSKQSGKSCKLVDGTGCWPSKDATVHLDCGKGAECQFKVSKAKAKIWCCRPKQSCKWYQTKCKWQNTFRCSNSALKKSKDKNGAQVLWE